MSPFYLMAYNTSECQRVKGALATEEFIRYDNQDTDNKDSMNGTHPYEKGKENVTIMYCYYERKYNQRSKTGKLECILNACSITNRNHIYPAFDKSRQTQKVAYDIKLGKTGEWLQEREVRKPLTHVK